MTEEQFHAFVSAVEYMRAKQKEYFRKRDYQTLEISKCAEKAVDKLIEQYKVKTLF